MLRHVRVFRFINNKYYVDTNYVGGAKTADIYAVVKVVRPVIMPFGAEDILCVGRKLRLVTDIEGVHSSRREMVKRLLIRKLLR